MLIILSPFFVFLGSIKRPFADFGADGRERLHISAASAWHARPMTWDFTYGGGRGACVLIFYSVVIPMGK
jgi:hypothetical protein